MADAPLRNRRRECTRCGRRDQPGHGCDRLWEFGLLGLTHSGFKRSNGSVSHLAWRLHWTWRGDAHTFTIRPSLGSHENVSERARRVEREREFNRNFDLDGVFDD